jgi:hypothetical protein
MLLDLAAKFGTPTSEGVRVDHGLTFEGSAGSSCERCKLIGVSELELKVFAELP